MGLRAKSHSYMPSYLKIRDTFISTFNDLKVLDIDAEFGDTSIYFAKNGAKVITVEQVSTNYNALLQNLKLNEGIKVTLENMQ
ncbi:MAG: hypothetical protein JZD40_07645 [Sulfolobus sp.]|nr:hypothetical protein [Sulfolobus sp.]